MRYATLQRKSLGKLCRRCINAKYHLHLVPKNCYYGPQPALCPRCKQAHNIVLAVRRRYKWRVWLHI